MSERLTTFRWQQLTAAEQSAVLERPAVKANAEVSAQAAAIIDRVKQGGDKALVDLAAELDHVSLTDLKVSDTEAAEAAGVIGPEACKAINFAIANVRAYHEAQQTAPSTAALHRNYAVRSGRNRRLQHTGDVHSRTSGWQG
jgi:histidinol dehydrogenase